MSALAAGPVFTLATGPVGSTPATQAALAQPVLHHADPEFRAMFKAKTGINSAGRFADRWERSWVSHYPGRPELEESNLAELARAGII